MLIIITLLLWPALAMAGEPSAPSTEGSVAAVAMPRSDDALKRLEEHVSEVRRDQLNYQIERDLLKEAYASNLQTINLALTIGLAILTIVGFFGVRGISTMRADFQKELEQLKSLRTDYESRLGAIEQQQAVAVSKVADLTRVNIEQDQRLQLLELQEKAGQFLTSGNPSRALEYVEIGLSHAPNDSQLLHLKSDCLMKQSRLREAIPVLKILVAQDQTDYIAGLNLCELSLLVKNVSESDGLLDRFRGDFARIPSLDSYLYALRHFAVGDAPALEAHVRTAVESFDPKSPDTGWGFGEVRGHLASEPDSRSKLLVQKLVDVIERKSTPESVLLELWPK